HGGELEAGSAARARARIGCMRQVLAGDARVLEPKPQRFSLQAQTNLRDARIIGVEDRLPTLGKVAERSLHRLGDLFELAVAVQLITEEIEDDHNLRLYLIDGFGKAGLIDLEHAPVGPQMTVRTGASTRVVAGPEGRVRPARGGEGEERQSRDVR